MAKPTISNPAQLTALYVAGAMLWIVGSDAVMALWHEESIAASLRHSAKGTLFVLVSGALLWVVSRRMLETNRAVSDELLRERAEAAALLERKERLQATIARANHAAVNCDDPDQLCQEICDALVGTAGMPLAWIGWEDPFARRIVPARSSGIETAMLGQLELATDTEEGGPAARALRDGRPKVCQEIWNGGSAAPWRDAGVKHGLNSCAVVPLRDGQGRRGTLTVHGANAHAFDRDIVAMLEQLAADLGRGLAVIAARLAVQRQTESLRLSEERWQFALEGAGDGVWDWNIDTGEVFYSRRLLEMIGYAPDEFRGRIEEWEQHIHPEDRPRVTATLQRYLNGEIAEYVCEHRVRTKRGDYIWILDRGKLFPEPGTGRAFRMIGTHSDITARKDAERQLNLLQAALQAAPVGVMITDREGTIEWVNTAFTTISGYEPAAVIGRNPRIQKSDRQDPAFYADLWQTITHGGTWHGELINRRQDGSEYPEAMTIAVVRDESGAVAHFVAVKQDVTERRQLEQQFLRAQRLEGVGQLASGIAHDLNNVLAPILLSVELLKLKSPEPSTRSSLEMIESAARRGANIVRQVLTFARGVDGERSPLRPRDIVAELSAILDETFPRQIRLEREVADDLPLIEGDATQMHQMLLNLAINARDAMENDGTLRLSVTRENAITARPSIAGPMPPGDYVVFRVADTGPGIPPELMMRIFEPFFTTKPKGKGTGLGLATTLGIVRSHHGYITVDTSARGTEFAVFLPAMPPADVTPDPVAPTSTLRGEGRLLLVCDDEPSIRNLTVAIFESRGFRVVVASDGRESLQFFARHRHELAGVVLDLMMPGANGAEVLAAIRREEPGLPVLLSSGLLSEAMSADALARETAAGPTGVIQKPYTAPSLLEALEKLLARAAPANRR